MSFDDEIRAAFDTIADRAPHPVRVQQALAAANRARSQRRALLIAGGIAAATAIVGGGTVAAARWAWRRAGVRPVAPSTPDPSPTPSIDPSTGNLLVPMAFRPGLLPEALTEWARTTWLSEPFYQLRLWSDRRADEEGSSRQQLTLSVVPDVVWPERESSEPVDVNGAPGRIWGDETQATVAWQIDGGQWLELWVKGFEESRSAAPALARSVERDGVSTLEVPMLVRWYPVDAPSRQSFGYWPLGLGEVLGLTIGNAAVASFTIRRANVEFEGAGPVTVRGRPATWIRDDSSVRISVPLEEGRFLVAEMGRGAVAGNPSIGQDPRTPYSGPVDRIDLSDDDALRVVEEMHIGPQPSYAWLGRH